ncbi:hypothetical protein O9G_005439 [Rozella allomycis CSF55]|uniref:Uncharacterized protein n=1 Tax=Rozella allomycis (strain CSF55) TaxID=988480 RepID=A0A075AML6_ROZAC|nr:hypothetical protein O9G_005439 [Rozella allomycis CSF55]|eukprot:EPZ30863.1 hypothetical protein O9G_005439 [Rozella allomycis CSF55]
MKNPEYVLMRKKQREEEYQRNKKPVTYFIDKVKDTFSNQLLRKNYEDLSRNGHFLINGKLSKNIISQLVKQARSRLKNYSSIFQTKEQAEDRTHLLMAGLYLSTPKHILYQSIISNVVLWVFDLRIRLFRLAIGPFAKNG